MLTIQFSHMFNIHMEHGKIQDEKDNKKNNHFCE